jgi:hypothetical protein
MSAATMLGCLVLFVLAVTSFLVLVLTVPRWW